MGPARATLPDGRLHFQHGPIDLIIGAEGDTGVLAVAARDAWTNFQDVLPGLSAELGELRRPMSQSPHVQGAVARRMVRAGACFPEVFLTPMAAVAGAVADDMIQCFQRGGIARAYVNNGGDIALHLTPGHSWRVGLARGHDGAEHHLAPGAWEIHATDATRGIATSGWRGRSFSLGIADSVTVTAASAALADAAATLVANAVNVDSPAVTRRPANTLKDDTDLGDRLVTVRVGALSVREIDIALEQGLAAARSWLARGLIHGACLVLAGHVRELRAASVAAIEARADPGTAADPRANHAA